MAHIEVLVDVPHLTADGNEEPHILQLKVDGLDAGLAWDVVHGLVGQFLAVEDAAQRNVDRRVQAAEGPRCNDNHYDPRTNCGYLCNLPPNHRGPHENFQSGRTWAQLTPQDPEQKRLYHQAQINQTRCDEKLDHLDSRCTLWKHHEGYHQNPREDQCA